MDKRILEKIETIKQTEDERNAAAVKEKAEAEERHKQYVESKLPEARKWVEDRLLDIIAEESSKDNSCYKAGKSSDLNLRYCDSQENGNRNIPVEAKARAASEIEGLYVRQVWVRESPDPNDETHRYTIPGHYEYSVIWKQF